MAAPLGTCCHNGKADGSYRTLSLLWAPQSHVVATGPGGGSMSSVLVFLLSANDSDRPLQDPAVRSAWGWEGCAGGHSLRVGRRFPAAPTPVLNRHTSSLSAAHLALGNQPRS